MENLKESFEQFIASREAFCSDRTVGNYRNTIRYFIEFLCSTMDMTAEDIAVDRITLADLNSYSVFLKNKVKNEGHPFYPFENSVVISSRTRKTYLRDMKTFLNFLHDEGIIANNPAKKFRMPRAVGKVIEPLTTAEVEAIDACISKNKIYGLRNLCLVHLLLDEGMRSGEVQRLKMKDVNFEEGYIVIRTTKGMKNRIIPLADNVRKYLKEYIEDKRPVVQHDYILCKNDDLPMTQESVKCVFDRLKKTSGILRLYPHLLRHTFGTSFILGGGSLELLRHYMGHSDITTTENYLHLANDYRFCKNVYKLDKVFLKNFY